MLTALLFENIEKTIIAQIIATSKVSTKYLGTIENKYNFFSADAALVAPSITLLSKILISLGF